MLACRRTKRVDDGEREVVESRYGARITEFGQARERMPAHRRHGVVQQREQRSERAAVADGGERDGDARAHQRVIGAGRASR